MNDLTPKSFRGLVEASAGSFLTNLLGSEEGARASARVGLAFAAAVRAAKKPQDLYRCSPESVSSAVAMSALTDLMPGGAMPLVWLIPRGGELQWMPSHRGLTVLAQRCGYIVRAVPVSHADQLEIEMGDVVKHVADPDSWPTSVSELRGVYVKITRMSDGASFGAPWLPSEAIAQRRKQGGPVWNQWPVEMAQKTAIRWAMARGYVPIEGIEMQQALEADKEPEPVKVSISAPVTEAANRLGLPDYGEPDTLDQTTDERERVHSETDSDTSA